MSGPAQGDRVQLPWTIIVSLPSEWSRLASRLHDRRPLGSGLDRAWTARLDRTPIALLETGVGLERAAERTRALLERVEPTTILSTGFGGALRPELRTGDLVIADAIHELSAADATSTVPGSDPALLARVLEAGTIGDRAIGGVRAGGFVSGPTVVRGLREREAIAIRHGASLVDMESAGVARVLREHEHPALFARAVLDEVTTELPAGIENFVTPEGRARPGEILRSLLRRPRNLACLMDLGRRSRQSAETIARFVTSFIRENS